MSEHNNQFVVERPVSASEAAPGLTEKLNAAAPRPARHILRRTLLATVALLGLAGAGHYGWSYWTVGRFQVATDDAYVKADSTTIAPKVSGYIAAVLVGDNEPVKAGQALARIDDRDFQVALEQAKAEVAAAEAAIVTRQATLDAQKATVGAARAAIDVDKANSTFATQDDKRYATLAASGYGSVQNAQQAASRSAASRATVERDQASLDAAIGQIAVLKAGLVEAKAALARANALEAQAELNLSYTTIAAPVDGVVGARSLRVGQYVQAGTQLMAVVPLAEAYIVANFKETQLANVRPGQRVEIEVDTFPGRAAARPRRQSRAGERPGIRAAAARQRHRQLHQGGATDSREDRARSRQRVRRSTASGHVGLSEHRHQGDGGANRRRHRAQRLTQKPGGSPCPPPIPQLPRTLPRPRLTKRASRRGSPCSPA